MLAKRQLSELVYDAVNLEGINFTLPEIQTLLNGITIGGRKFSDQQIAINQAQAWRILFNWIENDEFVVSAEKACELHEVAGKDEALEWGKFRKGSVIIAGTAHMPPKASELPGLFLRTKGVQFIQKTICLGRTILGNVQPNFFKILNCLR